MLNIDEVDLQTGIDIWQDEESYLYILSTFPQKHENSYIDLKNLITEEKIDEAILLAHSIKGLCANLAIPKLQRSSATIEMLLKDQNIEDSLKELENFREVLKRVNNSLLSLSM